MCAHRGICCLIYDLSGRRGEVPPLRYAEPALSEVEGVGMTGVEVRGKVPPLRYAPVGMTGMAMRGGGSSTPLRGACPERSRRGWNDGRR
ncbi:MAG: hypothetical protein LBK47_02175 [Prevotellaceae bacterium]|nr:hypothetical protein [Prevotellaceae bacterium]